MKPNTWIVFTNGEKLRLYLFQRHTGSKVIATSYHADGTVKQSTEIMGEKAAVVTQEE